MDWKDAASLVGGALLGNWVFERWLVKNGPDDPSGFVMLADGLGMDDFMRAGSAALGIVAVSMLVGK